ncbi:MAG: hypothetical protein H0U85_09975 [Gemmatimonadales bacterium]|nr:hypothetical protein [Gemmatimonadales bacterium]
MTAPTWRTLPGELRTLAGMLTVVQMVGYAVALVEVTFTTHLTPSGISARYRGSDPNATEGAMQFGKSLAEMLTSTHTHLLSMSVIFALSGACLAFCSAPPPRVRRFLVAEPFVALLVSFSAMWLMRYADPRFAWLLVASSALMAITFYVQSFFILRDLARAEPDVP